MKRFIIYALTTIIAYQIFLDDKRLGIMMFGAMIATYLFFNIGIGKKED